MFDPFTFSKKQQFFTKEAPGVILACELIDLNKRGLIEEEHESFLQNVLDNFKFLLMNGYRKILQMKMIG